MDLKLTLVEIVHLRWTAEGRSFEEIAVVEYCPVEVVAANLSSASKKLSATTLQDALENAKFRSLI